MAKRTTISVPDDLHEKMEKWKAELNFSKIFQDAVAEKIEIKERFEQAKNKAMGDKNMSATIERLRKEKAGSMDSFRERGKKDGFEWATNSHYDDIHFVLQWDGTEPEKHSTIHEYFTDLMKGEFGDGYESISHEPDPYQGRWLNEYGTEYIAGFIEGVESFWNEVSNQI